jgi:hypothetical protein
LKRFKAFCSLVILDCMSNKDVEEEYRASEKEKREGETSKK